MKVVDTDGDALSYTVFDAPTKGAVTVNPNGTYTYTPPTPQAGQPKGRREDTVDTFTVRVSDSLGFVQERVRDCPDQTRAGGAWKSGHRHVDPGQQLPDRGCLQR